MKTTNRLSVKNSLSIREKDIKKIYAVLTEFFDSIVFKADVKNGAEIEFDSMEELLAFENYGDRKIQNLKISASKKEKYQTIQECYFRFNKKCNSYTHPLDIDYSFTSLDAETLFVTKIKECFNRPQDLLNRRYLLYFVKAVVSLIIFIELFVAYQDSPVLLVMMILVVMGMVLDMVTSFFEKNVANVLFLWGEEVNVYQKKKALGSQIFWGVIVTAIISVVVAKLV